MLAVVETTIEQRYIVVISHNIGTYIPFEFLLYSLQLVHLPL